jgi:hypothetical protein
MAQPAAPEPSRLDVPVEELEGLVARSAGCLSAQDHTLLRRVVDTLVVVMRLLNGKRSALARLKRLFGLRSTEKTSTLFGGPGRQEANAGAGANGSARNDEATTTAAIPTPSADGAPPGGRPDGTPGGSSRGSADGDDDKATKQRKGHGRLGISDYPLAERIVVPHEQLHQGDQSPCCETGSIYDTGRPTVFLRLFGQALLIAKCWLCQTVRCCTCGKTFTAAPPVEARSTASRRSLSSR